MSHVQILYAVDIPPSTQKPQKSAGDARAAIFLPSQLAFQPPSRDLVTIFPDVVLL